MTNPEGPLGLCATVPPHRAGPALEILAERGLRDRRYRVRQDGERVLIPVSEGKAATQALDGADLVRVPVEPSPRWAPIEQIRERLSDTLTTDQQDALPTGWAMLGDVLVLRLPEALQDEAQPVARAYADVLGARSVLHLEGSVGPRREPDARLLHGDPDTETVHHEHGIAYHLDPSEVMFSPGNHRERHRLRDRVEDDTVVDLFAGIGYFTLPLADAGARVVACELNPTSAAYLQAGAEANDLADRIEIREGDCREVAPQGVADRVVMGYLPGTDRFLATARQALKPKGGTVHYHDAAQRPDPDKRALERVRDHEAMADAEIRVADARTVKSLDPERVHVALDLEVVP